MLNTNLINCPNCQKEYKRKIDLDKHIILCELLNKTQQDDDEIIPSNLQLYKLVKELAIQNKKLKEDIIDLKKIIQKGGISIKKADIIERLNSSKEKPKYIFNEWISLINITEMDISDLISDNIQNIVHNILIRHIEEYTPLPVVGCDIKKNNIYIYNISSNETTPESSPGTSPSNTNLFLTNIEPKWMKIEPENFMLLIKTLYQYLLKILQTKWKENNKQIHHFDEIFFKILQKITNMNIDNYNDSTNRKIFNSLYVLVSQSL